MVKLLVGLPDVNVLGVHDGRDMIEIHVECRRRRPGCPECGVLAHLKEQRVVTLVELPCFGKPTKLAWHKRRWRCADPDCPNGSWTEGDDRIAAPRLCLTGLRRDFPPEDLLQASDLGKLWISPDFRPGM
jgi:transposase